MLNSDLSSAAPQGGREPPPTDKTCLVSTHSRVLTNWVSGRTLQPSIESVVANSFMPSDFLVDGHVSGLGTVHPLLTFNFLSTWILPLHVPLSTLKRKSSSSVMDGLQRRSSFVRRKVLCSLSIKCCQWFFLVFPELIGSLSSGIPCQARHHADLIPDCSLKSEVFGCMSFFSICCEKGLFYYYYCHDL